MFLSMWIRKKGSRQLKKKNAQMKISESRYFFSIDEPCIQDHYYAQMTKFFTNPKITFYLQGIKARSNCFIGEF